MLPRRSPTTVGQTLCPFLARSLNKIAQAARRPQQRLHRVASRCRINQALKICHKGWVLNRLLLAPTACLADASRRSRPRLRRATQFGGTTGEGGGGQGNKRGGRIGVTPLGHQKTAVHCCVVVA